MCHPEVADAVGVNSSLRHQSPWLKFSLCWIQRLGRNSGFSVFLAHVQTTGM